MERIKAIVQLKETAELLKAIAKDLENETEQKTISQLLAEQEKKDNTNEDTR